MPPAFVPFSLRLLPLLLLKCRLSFLRTRRALARRFSGTKLVGFFFRAFRNLRNPPFYPPAPCLFELGLVPFSPSAFILFSRSLGTLHPSCPPYPESLRAPRRVDEKVSVPLVDALRNPPADRFTVRRDRKAALLSNDGAIPK